MQAIHVLKRRPALSEKDTPFGEKGTVPALGERETPPGEKEII